MSQELRNMSSIRKATVMEYPRVETESSPFVYPTNGLLTHAVESDEFVEFVRKLPKSTWFCEVAEA
jgi:S-adenosylmethionine hydrolase